MESLPSFLPVLLFPFLCHSYLLIFLSVIPLPIVLPFLRPIFFITYWSFKCTYELDLKHLQESKRKDGRNLHTLHTIVIGTFLQKYIKCSSLMFSFSTHNKNGKHSSSVDLPVFGRKWYMRQTFFANLQRTTFFALAISFLDHQISHVVMLY